MVEDADKVGAEVTEPTMADPMEPQGWVDEDVYGDKSYL